MVPAQTLNSWKLCGREMRCVLHGRDQDQGVVQRDDPFASRHEVHIVIVEEQAAFQCSDAVRYVKQSGFVFDGKPVEVVTGRINMFGIGKYAHCFRVPK